MSIERCVSADELHEVLALAPSDPRRVHLEHCPRCRALVRNYEAFLSSAEAPGADEARAALAAALADELGARPAGAARAPAGRADNRPRAAFGARLAWAFAAVAVIAALIVVGPRLRSGPPAPVLRGDTSEAPRLETPRFAADGSLALRWSAMPGALGYQVLLNDRDLAEIARLPLTTDTTLVIRAADVPGGLARGRVLLVRVFATRAEGEPLASDVALVRTP